MNNIALCTCTSQYNECSTILTILLELNLTKVNGYRENKMSPYICKTHIHVPRNMTSNSQHTYTHNTPKNKHITLYHRNNTHNANKFVAGGSFQSVWSRIGLTERNKWVQLRRTSHNLGMVRLVQKLDENGYCNKNTRYESPSLHAVFIVGAF